MSIKSEAVLLADCVYADYGGRDVGGDVREAIKVEEAVKLNPAIYMIRKERELQQEGRREA
jgi:hypothetical protein